MRRDRRLGGLVLCGLAIAASLPGCGRIGYQANADGAADSAVVDGDVPGWWMPGCAQRWRLVITNPGTDALRAGHVIEAPDALG